METKKIETVDELKDKYPKMFSHPELVEGEVWIGNFVIDILSAQLTAFKEAGMKSARIGKTVSTQKFTDSFTNRKLKVSCLPIFANVNEVIDAGVK